MKPGWWRIPRLCREVLWKATDYTPSAEQLAAHLDTHRVRMVAGGERGGKSRWTAAEIESWCFYLEHGLIWLVGPDYEQTRQEFRYVIDSLDKMGLLDPRAGVSTPKVGGWQAYTIHGTEISTRSAKDFKTLAGRAPDAVAMTEAAQTTLQAYLRCRGRVAERRGPLVLSGCLTGDTLVLTDKGLTALGDLIGIVSRPCDLGISGLVGPARATILWANGASETRRISLTKGIRIEGTPNHRVIARTADGSVTWRPLDDLRLGDLVAVRYGMELWGDGEIDNPYLLGLFIAEGCCSETDRFTFTNNDEPICEMLTTKGYFKHGYHYRKTDHALAAYWRSLGVDFTWKARTKRIPSGVLGAKREHVIAFLRGLFDGDGTATRGRVNLSTASEAMARQVQAVLLNLGLPCSITQRTCRTGGREFVNYNVFLADATAFARTVGFGLERKQRLAEGGVKPRFIRNQANAGTEFLGYLVMWCKVSGVETGFAETYDLHVPDGHAYWANGLIVHNTFETSMGWYADAWKRWQNQNPDDAKSFSLPSWSNLTIYPGGRQDPEILALERTTPADLFAERYGAIPCPPATRVMKEFSLIKHVSSDAQFNRADPVQLWVDPGYAHPYAVLAVQLRPGTDGYNVDHFDEVWEKGLTAKQIIEICKDRPWWFRVRAIVMDIAGRQHPGAESQSEIWKAETGLPIVMNKVPVVDGILRHRTYLMDDPHLERPRLRHNPCCKGTLWEYDTYRYQNLSDLRSATELPIDANNDAMKALAYGLVANFGFVDTKKRRNRNAIALKFN